MSNTHEQDSNQECYPEINILLPQGQCLKTLHDSLIRENKLQHIDYLESYFDSDTENWVPYQITRYSGRPRDGEDDLQVLAEITVLLPSSTTTQSILYAPTKRNLTHIIGSVYVDGLRHLIPRTYTLEEGKDTNDFKAEYSELSKCNTQLLQEIEALTEETTNTTVSAGCKEIWNTASRAIKQAILQRNQLLYKVNCGIWKFENKERWQHTRCSRGIRISTSTIKKIQEVNKITRWCDCVRHSAGAQQSLEIEAAAPHFATLRKSAEDLIKGVAEDRQSRFEKQISATLSSKEGASYTLERVRKSRSKTRRTLKIEELNKLLQDKTGKAGTPIEINRILDSTPALARIILTIISQKQENRKRGWKILEQAVEGKTELLFPESLDL